MSLINDALKRARESRQSPPSGAAPLPPVESPARGGTGWILVLAAILFLAAAGLFIGVALVKRPAQPAEITKIPEISQPPPSPVQPVSVAAPVLAPVSNAPSAASVTNPPPAALVEPQPKVQGIIFDTVHPVAIVNGKTVNVGDQVGDFQVKQILKNNVLFQRADGSLVTLKIGE